MFALPFALTGALLAWRDDNFNTAGWGWKLLWIVVAMVGMIVMSLAAMAASATLVLTIIKIAQEIRAYRTKGLEQTALRKLVDKLTRRSGFVETR